MGNIQLAKNLYTLRKSHGLTQDHMSELLNLSRQAYSNYEVGKRTPDLDSLIILSQLYNVTLDQIVNQHIGGSACEAKGPYTPGLHIENGDTLYLTAEEVDILMKYRTLSSVDQQVLQGFVESKCT